MLKSVAMLVCGVLCLASIGFAQNSGDRQYYSAWTKHSTKNYYYRNYNFKKAAGDEKYTYHYAIYFPSRGRKLFMYNPQSRKYWGAWDGEKYSLLPAEKQKSSIDEIAAEDFPSFASAPPIPGSTDKVAMIPPPKEFPKLDDDRP